jgi:hypothetical protein
MKLLILTVYVYLKLMKQNLRVFPTGIQVPVKHKSTYFENLIYHKL